MNIKEVLIKKSECPVRLIAKEISESDLIIYDEGDELAIEAIDFSSGILRVCNKSEIRDYVFEIPYNKENGELYGKWEFKT